MKIFSYWSERDTSAIAATIEAWAKHFPEFQIIGDNDVIPLLQRSAPKFVELYDRIVIPSCRSDLARLTFLYEHGRLYVDCDGHPSDPRTIRALLHDLDTYELILWNKKRKPSAKLCDLRAQRIDDPARLAGDGNAQRLAR